MKVGRLKVLDQVVSEEFSMGPIVCTKGPFRTVITQSDRNELKAQKENYFFI